MMQPLVITITPNVFRRYLNWTLWALMNLVAIAFSVLCFITARKLHNLSSHHSHQDFKEVRPIVILAYFMAAVVLLFLCVSFLVTYGLSKMKTCPSTLDAVLVLSLVYMFLITLLCAVMMHGFRVKTTHYRSHSTNVTDYYQARSSHDYGQRVREGNKEAVTSHRHEEPCYRRSSYQDYVYVDWSSSNTRLFTATFIMGYVLAGMYLLWAVICSWLAFVCYRISAQKLTENQLSETKSLLQQEGA